MQLQWNLRLLMPLLIATSAFLPNCNRPKQRPRVDPHLKRATALATSDPDAALRELDLAKGVPASEANFIRGMSLEKKRDFDGAATAYGEVLRHSPEHHPARTALARIQLGRGNAAAALELLGPELERGPSELQAILLFALAATTTEERNRALSALRAWPTARPSPPVGKQQIPLRSEYFLVLADLETDRTKATEALSRARSAELGSVDAVFAMTQYAILLDRKGLARSLLRRLTDSDLDAEKKIQIAHWSASLGDYATTDRILKHLPKHQHTHAIELLAAKSAMAQAQWERAMGHLESARQETPQSDATGLQELDLLLGKALLEAGRTGQAKARLRSVQEAAPNNPAAGLLLGTIELRERDARSAIARFRALAEVSPKDTALRLSIARLLLGHGQHAAAESHLRELLRLEPSAGAQRLLAECLHRQRREKEALTVLGKAHLEHPGDLLTLRALASQLIFMKDEKEAVSVVEGAAESAPNDVETVLVLADVLSALHRSQDTVDALRALVARVPQSARAWSALARAHQVNAELPAMEVALRKAIELEPSDLRTRAQLAALLQTRGKSQEAATLFSAIAQENSRDAIALNNAAMLFADELNDPDRAVPLAEEAAKLAPTNRAIMDTLGWSLARRGGALDLERAESLLEKASQEPDAFSAKLHYAYVLLETGRKAEGRQLLRELLDAPGAEEQHERARALLERP